MRAAACTPADLRALTLADAATATATATNITAPRKPPLPRHLNFTFPFVGGSEGLWEVTAAGEGVSSLRPGDLAIPTVPGKPRGTVPDTGTWRTRATLGEASLVKVPVAGGVQVEPIVAAHVSASMATAVRILEDFTSDEELGAGARVVFTGASSAVAQASFFCSGVALVKRGL